MTHHLCHARGCKVAVRPTLLMCGTHWRMVPATLKVRVLKAYRVGQCADKSPSKEWKDAAFEAIEAVAKIAAMPPKVRMAVRKDIDAKIASEGK